MYKDCLEFGTRTIHFTVIDRNRKTIQLNVEPEGEVVVMAPAGISPEVVKRVVKKKAMWIIKQQSFFKSYYQKPTKKEYVSGETHRYLGRQYRIKVQLNTRENIVIRRNFIHINVIHKKRVKEILEGWYRMRLNSLVDVITNELIKMMGTERIKINKVMIRNMKTRWGSCTPKGNIILHPALIKAPKECLRYVIIHELCHLKYMKHDWRFYAMLEKYCPNYIRIREKLNRQEIL